MGVGFDGKFEEGLDHAVEGTTRFLSGLDQLYKAKIEMDQLIVEC